MYNISIETKKNSTERKVQTMELRVAKKALESNGYERKLVYKLSYMTDNTWKHAYFENKEEAEMMVSKMMEVNKLTKIYSYISLNKWTWEMFIEP